MKKTDISIVLDRSGSMESIRKATIKGVNQFLKEQQNLECPAKLTLAQFDHFYDLCYEAVDIKAVKKLDERSFVPRGTTALLDAIGTTVQNTKSRIKKMEKEDRPDQVIVVIVTDGYENASTLYSRKKIFNLISKREQKDGWRFLFLAANQDAIAEGAQMGFSAKRCMTYASDDEGVLDSFHSVSFFMEAARTNDEVEPEFSEADRDAQKR